MSEPECRPPEFSVDAPVAVKLLEACQYRNELAAYDSYS